MSLLPYFFDGQCPFSRHRFYDQSPVPLFPTVCPWKQLSSELGAIKTDKDKFQVNVDVQHFSPEEVTVKIADGYVIVEGKHEEQKDDHGYISRQFTRRFKLPQGAQTDGVESKLSSDGVLSITAPLTLAVKGEKVVPISHTGPVKKEIAETGVKESEGKK